MAQVKKKASPYGSVKFTSIDEYHASFPPAVRKILKELREIIRKSAPKATETISYNMPAFKQKTNLVYYAAYKAHIGLYPTSSPIRVFTEDLEKYKTSKGAIQFPLDKPLPKTLISKIVKFRVNEDLATGKVKKI
ncbi:MAG: DUF1801 domain-containing protein [Bacteroidia bacterium]|nr:DUF1801 domain-containing protein [Bacteroidia bacterium]